jgi:hypothetical protein
MNRQARVPLAPLRRAEQHQATPINGLAQASTVALETEREHLDTVRAWSREAVLADAG